MIEIRSGSTPTFRGMLSILAMSALPFTPPTQASALVARSYSPVQAQDTGQLTHVELVPAFNSLELLSAMTECYRSMSDSQVSLEPDIAKILYDNLWNLYVED